MDSVLHEFKTVPGVVGALVCSRDGRLLAHSFPPTFHEAALAHAARRLADGAVGVGAMSGGARLLDLQFARARIVARLLDGAALLLLCAPNTNMHLLEILAAVAAPKLEVLVAGGGPAPAPPAALQANPDPTPATFLAPPAAALPRAGKLHALVLRIDAAIARRRLDPFATRGEIALLAGFSMGFIDAQTLDDPDKLARLKAAAATVLGEAV